MSRSVQILLLFALALVPLACTKSKAEHSATSTSPIASDPIRVTTSNAQEMGLPVRDGGSLDLRCLEQLPAGLSPNQWVQAIPRSCHEGYNQSGLTRRVAIDGRDRLVSIELPVAVRNSCWIAAVARESGDSAVQFELLDAEGGSHPLGALASQRALLPPGGPLCSLTGAFRSLVAKTDRDVSVVFHIAWYSNFSSEASDSP